MLYPNYKNYKQTFINKLLYTYSDPDLFGRLRHLDLFDDHENIIMIFKMNLKLI